MKKKIVIILFISLVSVGLAASGQSKKVDEEELLKKRLAAYDFYVKNSEGLGECTVRHEGARGNDINFPKDRSDIIMMYS